MATQTTLFNHKANKFPSCPPVKSHNNVRAQEAGSLCGQYVVSCRASLQSKLIVPVRYSSPHYQSIANGRGHGTSLTVRHRRSGPQASLSTTTLAGESEISVRDEVRAVLFDMDGVLCDSEERSREAAVALFAEMGVTVTTADFVPFMGTGEANFLGGVARAYNVEGFDPAKAKQRFFEIYIEKYAKPNSGLGYQGALELILKCKEAGLKCAVASSADRIKVDANLAAAGLPQSNFDAIVSADKFERLKPAPDIFLSAAKELGFAPRQCVVIEDALAGVQAARAAGMRCIAVTTTLSEGALAAANPSLIRPDIAHIQLKDILSLTSLDTGVADGGSPGGSVPARVAKETETEPASTSVSFQATLDAPLVLPGGYTTTRRNVIRLTGLAGGLGTTFFTLTHLKAFSYASPKAILNALLGGMSPPTGTGQGDNRIADLKQYIADIEQRGGGTQVPEFQSGLEWLNTPPLKLQKELRGKVVVLDFWTYCCINCMHVLPDLAFLENKYKDQPVVVVGVHSAKFDNEKDSQAIRNAVLRYDVAHPVVNDGEMTMWRALGISSWPTLALVSPSGRLLGMLAGEGHRQDLDDLLQASLEYYGERGQLDASPVPVTLEKDKDDRVLASPLRFPGKLATDLANGRLFISDSNNHRIVVTDLEGKFILQVGGAGGEGLRDGAFEVAAFNRPQGVAYDAARNVLYVADTENHALRAVDFVNESVRTLAGNGTKGRDYRGGQQGSEQVLNSPWDVELDAGGRQLYVAMAGQHQIWRHDVEAGTTAAFSGNGYERNQNGKTATDTAYAQPSGLSLAPGGTEMYVADSESSAIRAVDLRTGGSRLLAGGDPYFADNLFQFGDRDGVGSQALLQHPLGVLSADNGRVYITDSYNHRVKGLDLRTLEVSTLVGSGTAGFSDGTGTAVQLSEPAGLAQGPNGTIYIADTNNSVIRVLDPTAGNRVSTLDLSSVPPPPAAAPAGPRRPRRRRPAEADLVKVDPVTAGSGELRLEISIPEGYHFTKGAVSRFEADSEPDGALSLDPPSGALEERGLSATAALRFVRPAEAGAVARVNCKIYYCQQDEVCLYKAVTFEVPFVGEGSENARQQEVTLPYAVVPKVVNTTGLATR